eukprot:jgi/Astpho2/5240/gw1.00074.105.1_t
MLAGQCGGCSAAAVFRWGHAKVCGYCSTEQKLGERCQNCDKRIARNAVGSLGAPSRHWEGGSGCRDKKRLDRRDAAKYRNSKAKTVSKKAHRIG